MARRRLTIKRIDPWSVLKFGAFLSFVLYLILLVMAGVIWFIIDRLQLVDQACELALDVGFTTCGVNAINLFQVVALLGGMWVIVQTAVLVFLSFLHNLIADLTGGLVVGIVDDTAPPGSGMTGPARGATSGRSEPVTGASGQASSIGQDTRAVPAAAPAPRSGTNADRDARPRSPARSQPSEAGEALFGDDR